MKKFLVTFLVLCLGMISEVIAQDVIIMHDSNEIKARVISITPENITYKLWDNLEGPTYTVEKHKIFYIKYENGRKDIFSKSLSFENKTFTYSASTTPYQEPTKLVPCRFRGYADLGTIFLIGGIGPTIDITAGANIYEHFYIGFETGIHSIFGTYYNFIGGYIPITANLKGYLTRETIAIPYISCSLGGYISFAGIGGFFCQVGVGVDIKRISLGIGYNGIIREGSAGNTGYLKLGILFGK